jgi:hypothetical protein
MRLLILLPWLWPVQQAEPVTSRGACRLPRKACQRRRSCARVGVEVAKAAGMMPEHSPVLPKACRGPRVDDQRRTVPTSRRGASRPLGFGLFCPYPKWKSPTGHGKSSRVLQSRTGDVVSGLADKGQPQGPSCGPKGPKRHGLALQRQLPRTLHRGPRADPRQTAAVVDLRDGPRHCVTVSRFVTAPPGRTDTVSPIPHRSEAPLAEHSRPRGAPTCEHTQLT